MLWNTREYVLLAKHCSFCNYLFGSMTEFCSVWHEGVSSSHIHSPHKHVHGPPITKHAAALRSSALLPCPNTPRILPTTPWIVGNHLVEKAMLTDCYHCLHFLWKMQFSATFCYRINHLANSSDFSYKQQLSRHILHCLAGINSISFLFGILLVKKKRKTVLPLCSVFLINFYWSIVDLQCCVNFYCTNSEPVIHIHISTLF